MQFVDDTTIKDAPLDIPNERLIHTRYGFDIKLERRDPYGFVYVVWNKGPTPEKISGAFSDWDKARQAVTLYLNNNTFNYVTEEPVVIEKAGVKKRFRDAKAQDIKTA
jgi:hypothetical protein